MITTLCYLEKENKYLMLHRTKKENDINKNKWLGVGGKLEKNEKNKYFEKVKSISNNQYYLKVIDFFEYLSKESKNINEDNNLKMVKPKINEITQKMDEIDKILNNKDLREKYRISDEEAYSDQLTFFMVGGILKAVTGDTEGMVNDFINKIANKKISKEVAEYNKNKEMIHKYTFR